MAQRLPFHRSAKGTAPELVDCPPTVIHLWVVDRGAGPRVSRSGNSPVLAVLDGLHEAELVAAGAARLARAARGCMSPSPRTARPAGWGSAPRAIAPPRRVGPARRRGGA